jgi:TM2 domain-containing membrane protein YozV
LKRNELIDLGDKVGDLPEIRPGTGISRPTGGAAPPPHPLDGEWYMHVKGQTYGPYTGHQLGDFAKEGRLDAGTQVLAVGSENWTQAAQDRQLNVLFKRPSQQQMPPPITAAAGATVVHVTNQVMQPAMMMDDFGAFGPKSPGVALLLSFLICGAGQMYCGRVGKGILMLLGCIALWVIVMGWTIWIWSMIDAYTTAKNMNMRYLQRPQAGQPV